MFVLNLVYVALPLIQKYLANGVIIEISTISPETLIAPAITFISILGHYEDQGYIVVYQYWPHFDAHMSMQITDCIIIKEVLDA